MLAVSWNDATESSRDEIESRDISLVVLDMPALQAPTRSCSRAPGKVVYDGAAVPQERYVGLVETLARSCNNMSAWSIRCDRNGTAQKLHQSHSSSYANCWSVEVTWWFTMKRRIGLGKPAPNLLSRTR